MNEKRRACAPYQFFGAPWTASGTGQNAEHIGGSMNTLVSCSWEAIHLSGGSGAPVIRS
jgi:hypothetical protein